MTYREKRIFFNWLQKQGALKAYKLARHHQKIISPFESYEEMSINNPIGWAFNWIKTPEGPNFWRNLCFKWSDYLRVLKHK